MKPISIFLLSLLTLATATTCYNPDGSAITNPAFQPCNQVIGTISMCCGTNWTNGIVAKDICEPNGLCLNSYNGQPLYWRGSCTDPTWKSPLCLSNLCTEYSSNGDPTQNVALTDCGDGTWCCQGGYTTCCQQKQGVRIAATIGISDTTSSTSSTLSTSSTTSSPATTPNTSAAAQTTAFNPWASTATATPTNQPYNSQTPAGGLLNSAKIGLGVALGLVGVAVIAVATCFFLRHRHRNYYSTHSEGIKGKTELETKEKPQQLGPEVVQHEMEGDGPFLAELPDVRYSQGRVGDERVRWA